MYKHKKLKISKETQQAIDIFIKHFKPLIEKWEKERKI